MSNSRSLVWLVVCNVWSVAAYAQFGCPEQSGVGALGDGAIPVTIKLTINKIYNIDSRAETFDLDGYLEAHWRGGDGQPNDYYNAQALAKLQADRIRPMPEFINAIGTPEVQNVRVTVNDDGTVDYMERFTATFDTEMNFRQYPFDTQHLAVEVESFAEEKPLVRLVDCNVDFAERDPKAAITPEWSIDSNAVTTNVTDYTYADGSVYSRYRAEITLERNPGYYLWQFFLPLLLIVSTSWFVFWITDFGSKLGFAATLMLTIVAFNLYISALLPRLPYNTFLEVTIIAGYVAVFLTIVTVVVERLLRRDDQVTTADRLVNISRWLFPSGFAACILILTAKFHFFQ